LVASITFDPELIRRFREIFNVKGEIYIRRAFKAEDVKPTIGQ
jgi:hypothetical protein